MTDNEQSPPVQVAVENYDLSCPYCGQAVHDGTGLAIKFDYWKGLVYNNKKSVWLSPQESDLLKTLLEAWPDMISRVDLETKLYGARYHETTKSEKGKKVKHPIVHVISRLRIKLRSFGLYLHNCPGRGWWLSREAKEAYPRPTQPTADRQLIPIGRDTLG